MINFNQPDTYEHIDFPNIYFPFGCYPIHNLTTLPHWHPHTEIIYTQKGSVDIYINGTSYSCYEGDIQLIPANSLHSILPKNHAVYIAIVIGDKLLSEVANDLHFKQISCFLSEKSHLITYQLSTTNSFYKIIYPCIQTLLAEDCSNHPMKELMIKLEICRFFALLNRYIPDIIANSEKSYPSHTQNLKMAIEFLTNHYAEKITIKTMSQLMNMSEQHFSRLFKTYTGKTFVDYLTQFRLEQAKRLLIQSDLPITQIPELTGFCNPNYFSRIFKRHFGLSPSQTRKTKTL
ncbi:MAG: helix-turn-helix domain-containing protein [Velocimicrobium sp.]